MAKKYTTIEEVENYIGYDIDASFVSQVESWIEYVSDYIDKMTGRTFIAEQETRYYEVKEERDITIDGSYGSPRELVVDDIANTSKSGIVLKIDGNEISSDCFNLYPANSTPKIRIVLTEESGLEFTVGEQNIEVQALFGYSETVPAPIKFAATVLTAGIIQNNLSVEGELKSVTLGRYSATFKDEKQINDFENAKEILDLYTKKTI